MGVAIAVMARPTGDLRSIVLQGKGTNLGRFERVDTGSWRSCGGEEGGWCQSKTAVRHEAVFTRVGGVREKIETEANVNL